MLRRNAGRIAVGVWLASMALALGATVLLVSTLSTAVPNSWGFRGAAQLAAVTAGSVGAIILRRQPLNAIGWLFAVIGACFAVEGFVIEYTIAGALAFPGRLPLVREIGWSLTWIWLPSTGSALMFLPLLFPTGRPLSARWRPVAKLGAISLVLFGVALALTPGPMLQATYLTNPLTVTGVDPSVFTQVVQPIALIPFGLAILLSLASLVQRFRTSNGEARQQIKWFAFAASVLGAIFAVYIAVYLLLPGSLPAKALEVGVVAALLGLPVAAGTAILRYRLYEIDRIISRTLAYAVVTAVLAIMFAAIVLGLQAVLSAFTQRNTLAVAVSTLVVAALFQPIRAQVTAADQRFSRSRYDAERTVASFADRMRDQVDLGELRGDLSRVTFDALHPARVGVWIRSGGSGARLR